MNRIQKLLFRSILFKLANSSSPLSIHAIQSSIKFTQEYDLQSAIKALIDSGLLEKVNEHTLILTSKHSDAEIA